MEHVSRKTARILYIETNPSRRHQCRERTHEELPRRKREKANYDALDCIRRKQLLDTKMSRRGNTHRMERSENSRPLCTNPSEDTDSNEQHPTSLRGKDTTTFKMPGGRKSQQPGNARTNEVWKTDPEHGNIPCAKRACVTLGTIRKSRIWGIPNQRSLAQKAHESIRRGNGRKTSGTHIRETGTHSR